MHNDIKSVRASLSPQFLLIAACCNQSGDGVTKANTIDLCQQIDDWQVFTRFARRHGVQGFVQDRLREVTEIPSAIREVWANEQSKRVLVNLPQAQATAALHKVLLDADIPNLVLKGLPLAWQVYNSLSLKRSSDIDLLVSPRNAWRAVSQLSEEGFVSVATSRPPSEKQITALMHHFKEITLRNPQGVHVDLHWRLVNYPSILKGIKPFAETRSVELQNAGSVRVLSARHEFAYLCAHGALSNWSRFKWLADTNAFLARYADDEIIELFEYARSIGAGPSALQALALRSVFWDRPMPEPPTKEFAALDDPELLNLPIDAMQSPYKAETSRQTLGRIVRQSAVHATLCGSRAEATKQSAGNLWAVPDVMALPLPKWLDWLYIGLRPVFWAGRKLGS